ncbi:MAG: hypothetical protein CMJ78_25470 [Planctomycetaceae bacterium]|nr:hypothetical protein [Planctomycetaceae bacterium]
MPASRPQPVSGVAAGTEAAVTQVFPSVSSTGIGRLVGQLMESIPVPITPIIPIKLSHALFVGPATLIGLLEYARLKVMGVRYKLTTHSVQEWDSLGTRQLRDASLASIDSVEAVQQSGQEFFRAHDVVLKDASGATLMVLAGVPSGDVFAEQIVKTRDARTQVAAALAAIEARA